VYSDMVVVTFVLVVSSMTFTCSISNTSRVSYRSHGHRQTTAT